MDVDQLLPAGTVFVSPSALELAEILLGLEERLGVLIPLPERVDQEDGRSLAWAWALAKGEVVTATWSGGRVVVQDPEPFVAAIETGRLLVLQRLERFQFAGSEYPLGIVARALHGARLSGKSTVENGIELRLEASDPRAEERLVRPYKDMARTPE